jgi:hypothetical protein
VREAISFRTNVFQSTLVRPADTTPYASGDVFAAATGNACFVLGDAWTEDSPVVNDTSVARRNSETQSGNIDWLMLVSSVNAGTKPTGELWLFNKQPTLVADNAAFAPTLAELEDSLIGIVEVRSSDWSAGSGNAVCNIAGSARVFKLPNFSATATGQIFAVFVLRSAYTPTSAERLTLRANITRD